MPIKDNSVPTKPQSMYYGDLASPMTIEDDLGYVRGASYYFSGSCNLSCSYCFNPQMKQHNSTVNQRIRKNLESGKFMDILEKAMKGPGFRSFAMWGGEPSMNLPYLNPHLDAMLDRFKMLDEFSFSTNISTPALLRNILDFIKALNAAALRIYEKGDIRSIDVDVQVSMDGPPEINDPNRGLGLSEALQKNIKELTTQVYLLSIEMGDYELAPNFSIHISGKPTLAGDVVRKYLSKPEGVLRWYTFYDSFYKDIHDECIERATKLGTNIPLKELERLFKSRMPMLHNVTYATPGNYTARDGKHLASFYSILYEEDENGRNFFEMHDLKFMQTTGRPYDQYGVVFGKHSDDKFRMFYKDALSDGFEYQQAHACSAGLSSLGIDDEEQLHLCQETFFYDNKTMESVRSKNLQSSFNEKVGWDFGNYEKYVKGKLKADANDPWDVSRMKYYLQVPQTCGVAVQGYYEGLVSELWLQGQLDSQYFDDPLHRTLFASFMANKNNCQANNVFDTGHTFVETTSVAKFLGNGAFQILMEMWSRRKYFMEWFIPTDIAPHINR
ncbi:MAG: 4Fe-4S cluster-binding domain-containing protein [Actinobacteria bacterium]|nr:4Fe-4S cluster-binding domain-containing protein [Actinomycetota bacterium]MCA1807038.1 4Fe-4S cluster-binding domain-containing protein [Actinomycetota bacterium]